VEWGVNIPLLLKLHTGSPL